MPVDRLRSPLALARPSILLLALGGLAAPALAAGDPPAIVAVDPAAAFQGGGELVSLSLTGFTAGLPVEVAFGPAVTSGTPFGAGPTTTVTVLTPTTGITGVVDLTVTQGATVASAPAGFELLAAEIEGLSETSGPQAGGQALSAATNGFTPGAVVVRMGGTATQGTVLGVGAQQFVQWTTVAASTPGTKQVRFTQDGIDVILPDAFSFLAPQPTGVSPASAAWYQDQTLELSGANFAPNVPATVTIGGQGPLVGEVVSSQLVRVELPAAFLDRGGPLDVVLTQAGIDAVGPKAFTSLPALDITLSGNTATGGSLRFAVESVQGGFGVVYTALGTSPVPLAFPGVHSTLALDLATAIEIGSGGLLLDPTVLVLFGPGQLPPGLSLPVQGLAVEFGLLGSFAAFTQVEPLAIP